LPPKRVLDATAFFLDIPLEGELFTTPAVVEELVDARSRCRYEALAAAGLAVTSPGKSSLQAIQRAASATGDDPVLSRADRELLAVALETGAEIVSDDLPYRTLPGTSRSPSCPFNRGGPGRECGSSVARAAGGLQKSRVNARSAARG